MTISYIIKKKKKKDRFLFDFVPMYHFFFFTVICLDALIFISFTNTY